MWLCKFISIENSITSRSVDKLSPILKLLNTGSLLGQICITTNLAWLTRLLHKYCKSMDRIIDMFAGLKLEMSPKHTINVIKYALSIAQEIGLSLAVQRQVALAAALHDIGKTHIPDDILKKEGVFTVQDRETIRTHVASGKKIMEQISIFRKAEVSGVFYHHEHEDGSGYLSGLTGKDIPLIAQIIHVADVFDVLTNPEQRGYIKEKVLSRREALEKLLSESGKAFNSEVLSHGLVPWVEKGCQKPKQKGINFLERVKDEIDVRNIESVRKFLKTLYVELPRFILTILDSSDGLNLRGCNPYPFAEYCLGFAQYLGVSQELWRGVVLYGLMVSVSDMWLPENIPETKKARMAAKRCSYEITRKLFHGAPGFEVVDRINADFYENYNGKFGLKGKKGNRIYWLARMMRVPILYVHRGYNAEALNILKEQNCGTLLDPHYLEKFTDYIEQDGIS